jgi:hypothetical protein
MLRIATDATEAVATIVIGKGCAAGLGLGLMLESGLELGLIVGSGLGVGLMLEGEVFIVKVTTSEEAAKVVNPLSAVADIWTNKV